MEPYGPDTYLVTQQWLNDLRTLLVLGWLLLAGVWLWMQFEQRPDKPKATPAPDPFCPLHRIPRSACDSKHDPEE